MKRIVIDVDNTLTMDSKESDYRNAIPNRRVINKLRKYANDGFEIVVFTARNMKTFSGEIGKINVFTLPVLMEWLDHHDVPYDEIIMGKPWCGNDGFYVDDKAIRPAEFLTLSHNQIKEIIQ